MVSEGEEEEEDPARQGGSSRHCRQRRGSYQRCLWRGPAQRFEGEACGDLTGGVRRRFKEDLTRRGRREKDREVVTERRMREEVKYLLLRNICSSTSSRQQFGKREEKREERTASTPHGALNARDRKMNLPQHHLSWFSPPLPRAAVPLKMRTTRRQK